MRGVVSEHERTAEVKGTGKINFISRDTASGRYLVQMETDSRILAGYEELKNEEVDVIIKKHRAKRNLDQNALYWCYVTELARVAGQSIAWMHNHLLAHYGYPFMVNGKVAMVVLPDDDETVQESETFHCKPTSQVKEGRDGTMFRTYIVMRGSSTYNTQEMSRLIDGAEREARQSGIHLEEHYYK